MVGLLPPSVIRHLLTLVVPLISIHLLVFQFAFDHVHVNACLCDLVLAHLGVVGPDLHEQVALLKHRFLLEVTLPLLPITFHVGVHDVSVVLGLLVGVFVVLVVVEVRIELFACGLWLLLEEGSDVAELERVKSVENPGKSASFTR